MKTKYYCSKCNKEFDLPHECVLHEENCGKKEKFICDKCGKVIEYDLTDVFDWKIEECHYINLGRSGYGSMLDNCDISFNLCDNCLYDLVTSLSKEAQQRMGVIG